MRKAVLLMALVLLVLLASLPVSAQRLNPCDFYTKTPSPGMLPLGTVVDFQHWEGSSQTNSRLVTRTGTVACYYIRAQFPGGSIIGLDDQAYIVDYSDASGAFIILNRNALTVH